MKKIDIQTDELYINNHHDKSYTNLTKRTKERQGKKIIIQQQHNSNKNLIYDKNSTRICSRKIIYHQNKN